MGGVRVGVDVLLRGLLGEGVGDGSAGDGRGQGDVPRRDPLGHRQDVGYDAVVLDGEPPAGPAKAGDHFVGDHQDVEIVADPAHRLQPAHRRDDEPTR
jgi:hypothetical protein